MEEIKQISQYRKRLDKTLAAHELSNVGSLEKLVTAQMQRSLKCELKESIAKIAGKRTEELFNCVQMLKSASEYDDVEKSIDEHERVWKLKQDTEEYRVMYREGPEGTPFHSLLVEGYVDGPLDICLCIAWESHLYSKWWPQSSIPTFKILSSECLQKVRDGEQICLVRMKLSWPLSSREAVVHFFEFEYFQDDLIVVFFNSIRDLESDDRSFEGFSRDAIPDTKDVTRIDLLGGMALQKVSANRSYFRTIANMDVKLNFVSPSIINFVSRQLIGSGFKLYKKEVAAVSKGHEDFSKALEDPLHCRIRDALYSDNKQISLQSEITNETLSEDKIVVDSGHKTVTEIEEVEEKNVEESKELEENSNKIDDLAHKNKYKEDDKSSSDSNKRKVTISPQVKQALDTLEKAISFLRENKSSNSCIPRSSSSSRRRSVKESKPSGEDLNELRISFGNRSSRRMGSNPYIREANHSNKVVPSSTEVSPLHPSEPHDMSLQDDFSFHLMGVDTSFAIDNNHEVHNSTKSKAKHKKLRRFCCLPTSSEQF